MAQMKELYFEYQELVEKLKFGERTQELIAEWEQWNTDHKADLAEMGIDTSNLFDSVYQELQHLYEPTNAHNTIINKWANQVRSHLDIEPGDLTNKLLEQLTETYQFGSSSELQATINQIASIPLMTTEVLQSIIYKAARQMPHDTIIGLDKVTIIV